MLSDLLQIQEQTGASSPAPVVPIERPGVLLSREVVGLLGGLQLDPAEGLAELAQEHVFDEPGWNVVFS